MKKAVITAFLLALAALWGWRVYAVNHDPVVEYIKRKTVVVEAGETADLVFTDFPTGNTDLTGYHVRVTGARLVNTVDLLRENGYDESFFETEDVDPNCTLTLLVDVVFWYDGEEDPQNKPVFLSNFRLVGDSWYTWYSWEMDGLGFLNPVLEGDHVFAIVSGKEFALTLPFLIQADNGGAFDASMSGITTKDILSSPPRLLLAEYPTQILAELPAIEQ